MAIFRTTDLAYDLLGHIAAPRLSIKPIRHLGPQVDARGVERPRNTAEV